jgi:ABC-type polysaccharide/polyol phosphate export permease
MTSAVQRQRSIISDLFREWEVVWAKKQRSRSASMRLSRAWVTRSPICIVLLMYLLAEVFTILGF